jgi:hypothetical protein
LSQVYIKVSCTQELAGAVEHFCELLADVESEDMASLEHGDVEKVLFEKGTETLRRLYQGHLDLRARREVKHESVVGSDQIERNHRRASCERDPMTLFGQVAVRRLGYSSRGHGNLFPLDGELNLPTDKFSHGLHERVALEVVKGSFEQASLSVERTTRGKVAKRQAEELAVAVARDFKAFYESKRKERHALSDDLLIISVDGKGVVMRPDALREATRKSAEKQNHKLQTRLSKGEKRNRKRMATVATVYSIERHERTAESIMGDQDEANQSEKPRAKDKRVWASVENDSERVIQEALEEALSKDPKQKRQWVVLVDGQEQQIKYIKSCAKRLGVKVTLVLDFIHVLEYLWKAAYCFEAEGSEAAEESVRARALNILHGNAGNVAAGIRRSATLRGLSEKERAAADASADYLLKYTDMMHYDRYLADGFPIATGVIEGACRHLIKDRMDITGARWGLETAEAVLKLRSLYTSGDFDEYLQYHKKAEFERVHRSRYATYPLSQSA